MKPTTLDQQMHMAEIKPATDEEAEALRQFLDPLRLLARIEAQRAEIAALTGKILQRTEQIELRNEVVVALRAEIATRDAELLALHGKYSTLSASHYDLQKLADAAHRDCTTALARAEAVERELLALREALEDVDSEVLLTGHLQELVATALTSTAASAERIVAEIEVRATAREQERCAKLVENHGHSNGRILASHKHLAAAIRGGPND